MGIKLEELLAAIHFTTKLHDNFINGLVPVSSLLDPSLQPKTLSSIIQYMPNYLDNFSTVDIEKFQTYVQKQNLEFNEFNLQI